MNALVKDPTTWTDVGAVTDIPLRGARRVPTPRGAVAIFRTGDGQVFALRDACPHKGGPLSQGIVHGHAVACPRKDGRRTAPQIFCSGCRSERPRLHAPLPR